MLEVLAGPPVEERPVVPECQAVVLRMHPSRQRAPAVRQWRALRVLRVRTQVGHE